MRSSKAWLRGRIRCSAAPKTGLISPSTGWSATPLVATVSLGERRRFLMRRRGGGPTSLTLQPGEGDLVVMGGDCQHDWEHTVPKVRSAGARMSVTLRHSQSAG